MEKNFEIFPSFFSILGASFALPERVRRFDEGIFRPVSAVFDRTSEATQQVRHFCARYEEKNFFGKGIVVPKFFPRNFFLRFVSISTGMFSESGEF